MAEGRRPSAGDAALQPHFVSPADAALQPPAPLTPEDAPLGRSSAEVVIRFQLEEGKRMTQRVRHADTARAILRKCCRAIAERYQGRSAAAAEFERGHEHYCFTADGAAAPAVVSSDERLLDTPLLRELLAGAGGERAELRLALRDAPPEAPAAARAPPPAASGEVPPRVAVSPLRPRASTATGGALQPAPADASARVPPLPSPRARAPGSCPADSPPQSRPRSTTASPTAGSASGTKKRWFAPAVNLRSSSNEVLGSSIQSASARVPMRASPVTAGPRPGTPGRAAPGSAAAAPLFPAGGAPPAGAPEPAAAPAPESVAESAPEPAPELELPTAASAGPPPPKPAPSPSQPAFRDPAPATEQEAPRPARGSSPVREGSAPPGTPQQGSPQQGRDGSSGTPSGAQRQEAAGLLGGAEAQEEGGRRRPSPQPPPLRLLSGSSPSPGPPPSGGGVYRSQQPPRPPRAAQPPQGVVPQQSPMRPLTGSPRPDEAPQQQQHALRPVPLSPAARHAPDALAPLEAEVAEARRSGDDEALIDALQRLAQRREELAAAAAREAAAARAAVRHARRELLHAPAVTALLLDEAERQRALLAEAAALPPAAAQLCSDLLAALAQAQARLAEAEARPPHPHPPPPPPPPPPAVSAPRSAATQTEPGALAPQFGYRQRRVSALVAPGSLLAELRVTRGHRRAADPQRRRAGALLRDAALLRPSYPGPPRAPPPSAAGRPAPPGDDQLLGPLARAMAAEREAHAAALCSAARDAQRLRHGWLGEAAKVERLATLVEELARAGEAADAELGAEARAEAELLCGIVHRRVDSEIGAADAEAGELRVRADWCLAQLSRCADSRGADVAQLAQQFWERDACWEERVSALECENDALAQRVALLDAQGGTSDEAAHLAVRVVQLEEELAREKDLRMAYAVEGEVRKRVGVTGTWREQLLRQVGCPAESDPAPVPGELAAA